jgi:ABC-type transporter Mla subunit MlaD
MMTNISLIVEIVLSALLLATVVYCSILERRLSALRKGQDGLKDTIAQLNQAIVNAGSSMRALKSTAAGAAETLDERIARGRGLADELSLLTASGERIAQRIDRGASPAPVPARTVVPMPAALNARLESLKPAALRSVR